MKIPTVPAPDWHLKFAANLDKAIAFHEANTNDPHNVGTGTIVALREVRECFGLAVCGKELPDVTVAKL